MSKDKEEEIGKDAEYLVSMMAYQDFLNYGVLKTKSVQITSKGYMVGVRHQGNPSSS